MLDQYTYTTRTFKCVSQNENVSYAFKLMLDHVDDGNRTTKIVSQFGNINPKTPD